MRHTPVVHLSAQVLDDLVDGSIFEEEAVDRLKHMNIRSQKAECVQGRVFGDRVVEAKCSHRCCETRGLRAVRPRTPAHLRL